MIAYQWGFPTNILITENRVKHSILTIVEGLKLLHFWGIIPESLPAGSSQHKADKSTPSWHYPSKKYWHKWDYTLLNKLQLICSSLVLSFFAINLTNFHPLTYSAIFIIILLILYVLFLSLSVCCWHFSIFCLSYISTSFIICSFSWTTHHAMECLCIHWLRSTPAIGHLHAFPLRKRDPRKVGMKWPQMVWKVLKNTNYIELIWQYFSSIKNIKPSTCHQNNNVDNIKTNTLVPFTH